MLLDELQELRVDRRPDRARVGARVQVGVDDVRIGIATRVGHVLDRDLDLEVERLALASVHHRAVAPGADEEARDALERPLRGR